MFKKMIIIILLVLSGFILNINSITGNCMIIEKNLSIKMAVEFTDHAACAYISQEKGWFVEENLDAISYESYVTGMALASALGRGDIQVSYMCLVPAIILYANAKIPIQIVAGTHKYGYGLAVNRDRITRIEDLEKQGIQIGCVREGGAVDILLHKMIEEYHLNGDKIVSNLNRMSPPQQILALQAGKLDAVFVPEQWATMAEESGFVMLMESQDIWPGMQGSVLVVKADLLEDFPEIVEKLVRITEKSTDWINENLEEAAKIVAQKLTLDSEAVFSTQIGKNTNTNNIEFLSDTLFKSMKRLKYTTEIGLVDVQNTIDFLEELGYIKNTFDANEILDLRFLTK